ncbi:glycosyltransferase family 2 protein [Streptomyces flavalbus]|uniref:Glycosyltransferase family 2 protein n=1 Tax=Streptomyces flavalbus TaxID=2665155 RepID=A0ABW2WGC7_9ACTN
MVERPAALAALAAPEPPELPERGTLMTLVASAVLVCFLLYVLGMFALGRKESAPGTGDGPMDPLLFVFVLPCLDEELVIGASLERLLALPDRNWVALVVDDGSTDGTADIVGRCADPRVLLLRRTPPQARQGKGAALNAAYRHLRTTWHTPAFAGYGADQIIVAVLDADGRLSPDALCVVAPAFRDPGVGAVQIAVRIHNAPSGLLARLQDIEFVTFTEIFQRARSRIGSAGLGGNGQFTRLSALETVGEAPWSRCLTEDLDLGVRLVCHGWRSHFTSRTHVAQQGLTRPRPFLRQRTRWFQGHLQCATRIPGILRAQLALRVAADLLITLTLPLLVLLTTFSVVAFYVGAVAVATGLTDARTTLDTLTAHHGAALVVWALVSFGVAPVCAYVYHRAEARTGPVRAVLYGFLFTLYCYHWLPVGWAAVWRQLSGRGVWTKTRRLPEPPPPARTPAGSRPGTRTAV